MCAEPYGKRGKSRKRKQQPLGRRDTSLIWRSALREPANIAGTFLLWHQRHVAPGSASLCMSRRSRWLKSSRIVGSRRTCVRSPEFALVVSFLFIPRGGKETDSGDAREASIPSITLLCRGAERFYQERPPSHIHILDFDFVVALHHTPPRDLTSISVVIVPLSFSACPFFPYRALVVAAPFLARVFSNPLSLLSRDFARCALRFQTLEALRAYRAKYGV